MPVVAGKKKVRGEPRTTEYRLIIAATVVYLTFLGGCIYNAWYWPLKRLVSAFWALVWPFYWGTWRWIPARRESDRDDDAAVRS